MRVVRILSGAVFAVVVFLAGVWLFAPWESGAVYALDRFRVAAAYKGCYVNYSGFESSGVIRPVYRLRSLDIEGSNSRASLSDVVVKVFPFSSLFSGSASCCVEFGGGNASLILMDSVLNDILSLDRGKFSLSASRNRLRVSDVRINGASGDVRVSGGLDYDRLNRTVMDNTVTIKVPDNIDSIIGGMGAGFIGRYIERSNPGEWRVRNNAISGR
ncbi:MAG: AsmA-like C-terminal region-containing protein [Synergistaceae bacterium]|jgi:hypothetical protein|nr:AsmA-like C-terminal region-containing protein [Synergistaceae bacterium]